MKTFETLRCRHLPLLGAPLLRLALLLLLLLLLLPLLDRFLLRRRNRQCRLQNLRRFVAKEFDWSLATFFLVVAVDVVEEGLGQSVPFYHRSSPKPCWQVLLPKEQQELEL